MEMLKKYNSHARSLLKIVRDVKRFPFEARMSEFGEGFGVMVTDFRNGGVYGFPVFNGKRTDSSWYVKSCSDSVFIPNQDFVDWTLVDTPFDNLEDILFVLDLHDNIIPSQEKMPPLAPNVKRPLFKTFKEKNTSEEKTGKAVPTVSISPLSMRLMEQLPQLFKPQICKEK